MKKILDRKLSLAKETVRELSGEQLANVGGAGGMVVQSFATTVTAPCRGSLAATGPAATPCRNHSNAVTLTAPCRTITA